MVHTLRFRLKKPRVLGAFFHCGVYMFLPSEAIFQVYAEKFSTVNHFQHVSMEPVDGLSLKASLLRYTRITWHFSG